mmetsp:Transcript_49126/g.86765  ORF Transcript_49126/g.86765 Transcript_49126/m.86765 type:complete len:241 (-) Transcript_49126:7-729(-)
MAARHRVAHQPQVVGEVVEAGARKAFEGGVHVLVHGVPHERPHVAEWRGDVLPQRDGADIGALVGRHARALRSALRGVAHRAVPHPEEAPLRAVDEVLDLAERRRLGGLLHEDIRPVGHAVVVLEHKHVLHAILPQQRPRGGVALRHLVPVVVDVRDAQLLGDAGSIDDHDVRLQRSGECLQVALACRRLADHGDAVEERGEEGETERCERRRRPRHERTGGGGEERRAATARGPASKCG